MKILIYSYVFLPSIGGIEVVSATLAENLCLLGHSVTVVTETPAATEVDTKPYKIIRRPSWKLRLSLVREHDIIHSNGASMALFFHALLLRKPFLWTHGGYQLSCIDGLGWVSGIPAPLEPWESIKFHYKLSGFKLAFKEAVKLYLRRVAGHMVAANVAITQWVAMRQPLPRQAVIYNPFPLESFSRIPKDLPKVYDFIYVGRLVSEKGVPQLITAFAQLKTLLPDRSISLAIVGDGNWKDKLEKLTKDLSAEQEITFFGKKTGTQLHDLVAQASIAIVPSVWEEPMGGVALELMAAGKNIIVSRKGGLYECTGAGALVFDNGDAQQLAQCMLQLFTDPNLQNTQKEALQNQLKKFDPLTLTCQYENLYIKIIEKS